MIPTSTTSGRLDRILERRLSDSRFLVHWKGYGAHEDSWPSKKDLKGAPRLLAEFEEREEGAKELVGKFSTEGPTERARGGLMKAIPTFPETASMTPPGDREYLGR